MARSRGICKWSVRKREKPLKKMLNVETACYCLGETAREQLEELLSVAAVRILSYGGKMWSWLRKLVAGVNVRVEVGLA